MARTKEGKVEAYFKARVKAHGGLSRKTKWLCRRGAPDEFWAFPGKRSGFAEIKPPDRRYLDPHQEREHTKLRAAGVICYLIASEEDVDRFIEKEA